MSCSAADAPYDFDILESYDEDSGGVATPHYGWYGYGDLTPGASWLGQNAPGATPPVVAIENGGPCGQTSLPSAPSDMALFLEASGFQDYGNGWGTYNIGVFYPALAAGPQTVQPDGSACVYPPADAGETPAVGVCPIDATGWDGLTFWARSFDPTGAPTSKGFTLTINDKESASGVDSTCVPYDAGYLANGSAVYTVVPVGGTTGPSGGGVTSALPPADACGNGFAYPLLTTGEWQLYTLPWSAFSQLARPNRIPTGFDPSSFFQITISAPKEARSALWIDSLGFYRAKQPGAGLEAGP